MRKWLLALMLCSLCFISACGSANVLAQELLETEVVVEETAENRVKTVTLESDRIPTFEEVLFIEVPESEYAAKDFLEMTGSLGLTLKHITIKDYGYGNYTLNCDFTDTTYDILVYVRAEENVIKWYGTLKHNEEEIQLWSYNNYN